MASSNVSNVINVINWSAMPHIALQQFPEPSERGNSVLIQDVSPR